MSYYVKRLCYYDKKSGYLVYEACELVCYKLVKRMVCYVHTLSYSVERICYYVKIWVILSMRHLNLFIQSVIMFNGWAVLSTQSLIMLKGYVVM